MSAALPKGYVCRRTDAALSLNGRLDDPAWAAAPWTDDFVDIEGGLRPAPRYRTRVKMLWDAEFLYIGAELEEPHVWATLTEHDSVIFQDNDFEVFIDPDGDNHNYYEIEINALNTEWDLRLPKPYRDGGSAIDAWEIPGLRTAVHIDGTLNDARDIDRGWTVELALPWAVLGEYSGRATAPPSEGDWWRINFSRVEWDVEITDGRYVKVPNRAEHNWVWTPQHAIDMHRPERWGYVQFTVAPPSEAVPLRPDPSFAAREFLMGVYHAQREARRRSGVWATSLPDLAPLSGQPAVPQPTAPCKFEMRVTAEGFEAIAHFVDERGVTARLHVDQSSRLWIG